MKKFITRPIQKLRNTKERLTHRDCNLCERNFKMLTPFQRFCESCKKENELYQSAEWFPQAAVCI